MPTECETGEYSLVLNADGTTGREVPNDEGFASPFSCVANLSNAILGAGLLALPYGFAQVCAPLCLQPIVLILSHTRNLPRV